MKTRWILVLGIYFAGHDEMHALGPFGSERACIQRRAMIGMSMQQDWLGICFDEGEFRRLYPTLAVDTES